MQLGIRKWQLGYGFWQVSQIDFMFFVEFYLITKKFNIKHERFAASFKTILINN
jgi:hypothetical protein